MTTSRPSTPPPASKVQNDVHDTTPFKSYAEIAVSPSKSQARSDPNALHVTAHDFALAKDLETTSAQSSPESVAHDDSDDGDDATGAHGSIVDLGSPSQALTQAENSFESFGTPLSSSSYDLIGTTPSPQQSIPSKVSIVQDEKKTSSGDKKQSVGFPSHLVTLPVAKKVTISAPPPLSTPSPAERRSSAWSHISRDAGSKKGSLASSNIGDATPGRRDRHPSHGGIRQVNDDQLDPSVQDFEPKQEDVGEFNENVAWQFIVKNGKTMFGDLTKEARLALAKRGMKTIPSMHGPSSLPYARCPSGIDAFLFSIEKQDDPYTFILDPEPRRRPVVRNHRAPLPGNSRYSQALQKGFLPTRIVSAPVVLHDEPHSTGPRLQSTHHSAQTSQNLPHDPAAGNVHTESSIMPQPNDGNTSSVDWTYGASSYDAFMPSSSAAPYWSNPYLFSGGFYPPYTSPYFQPPMGMYPAVPTTVSLDPSSYTHAQQPRPETTFQDNQSDHDTEIEPHLGGFFFPLHRPTSAHGARRQSTASQAASKLSSVPSQSYLGGLGAFGHYGGGLDRRNSSAVPATALSARRSSLGINISPRRSSVAPATRLVRDPIVPPITPPPIGTSSRAALVPHHSRPSSSANLKTFGSLTSSREVLTAANWRRPSIIATDETGEAAISSSSPKAQSNENHRDSGAPAPRGRIRRTRGRGGKKSTGNITPRAPSSPVPRQ